MKATLSSPLKKGTFLLRNPLLPILITHTKLDMGSPLCPDVTQSDDDDVQPPV